MLKAIVLAAALGLTAAQAQAVCNPPRQWGGTEENVFNMCQRQEEQDWDAHYRRLDRWQDRTDRIWNRLLFGDPQQRY